MNKLKLSILNGLHVIVLNTLHMGRKIFTENGFPVTELCLHRIRSAQRVDQQTLTSSFQDTSTVLS